MTDKMSEIQDGELWLENRKCQFGKYPQECQDVCEHCLFSEIDRLKAENAVHKGNRVAWVVRALNKIVWKVRKEDVNNIIAEVNDLGFEGYFMFTGNEVIYHSKPSEQEKATSRRASTPAVPEDATTDSTTLGSRDAPETRRVGKKPKEMKK